MMLCFKSHQQVHIIACPCPCPCHSGSSASAGIEMGCETTTTSSHLPPLSAPGLFTCSCANSTEFRLMRLHVHGSWTQSLPEPCRLCHTADSHAAPNLLWLLDNLEFGFTVYKVLHKIYHKTGGRYYEGGF